jgi:hypothetical protein
MPLEPFKHHTKFHQVSPYQHMDSQSHTTVNMSSEVIFKTDVLNDLELLYSDIF